MASFWDLLPASWPGQSLDPYLPFAAMPPAGGSKGAAPSVASAVPPGGSSNPDDQAQPRPMTLWDLLPPPQPGQPFTGFAPIFNPPGPDPWLVAAPQAGGSKAARPAMAPLGDSAQTSARDAVGSPHAIAGAAIVPSGGHYDLYSMPLRLSASSPPPSATRFPLGPGTVDPTGSGPSIVAHGPLALPAAPVAAAPEVPLATRLGFGALTATGALASLFLLGSTRRTADDDGRPEYVVRGGLSAPDRLKKGVSELTDLPGEYGISSSYDPRLSVDKIAAIARYPNKQITWTTAPRLDALGYRVAPTPILTGPKPNPLHADILLPNGQRILTDEQADALSALFHPQPNPYMAP